ncbi:MAG: hypothetical protein NDI67_04725 [Sulfuritalea sp.]|nr:hypothetical protein [Sulfuritalea sp.]
MTGTRFVAALLCLPLLAACATPYSEAPLATNFPTSKQQKLQAAAHWNVIAGDVAKQISSGLKEKRPLFVNQSLVKTAFDRAFTNDLISALVAEGYTVMKSPDGALSVDVDTQAVRFSPNRPQYNHTGLATAVTAGVWALRDVSLDTAGQVLGAGVAVAAAADAYSWFRSEFASGQTPQTEIIVTTSVSDARQYLARRTSIYYVADSDSRMYVYEPPFQAQTKNIGVTGQ